MHPSAQLDLDYVWHPFTQMRDWFQSEPVVIHSAKGALLKDVHGQSYLDANSSIWTNLHGHRNREIDRAIRTQLTRVAHVSALGLANEPAAQLAQKLVQACRVPEAQLHSAPPIDPSCPPVGAALSKVFFSDDGSTAMETGLKLAHEFIRRTRGVEKPRYLSIDGAYHGDTIGAVSLGHIDLFHKSYGSLLFQADKVMAPSCYRCPFNKAKPERADARATRKCAWECVDQVESAFARQKQTGDPYALMSIEPLVQGAAGMVAHPQGWLRRVAQIAREHQCLLLFDEVLTGFARTGVNRMADGTEGLFAFQKEGVVPDLIALAKGMSGGYLPMAATLATSEIFSAFLGAYSEFKTFFHGHSYTGNPLGAAASLASMTLLQSTQGRTHRADLERWLSQELQGLWQIPWVGDIRQIGLISGIELVRDWTEHTPFPLQERVGFRVCEAMMRRGVITRPIGGVIVIMPPYCTTKKQIRTMVSVLGDAIHEVLGNPKKHGGTA